MVFTDIRLQNYRSYDDSSFDFEPMVNIIVGPNTIGKTNLLEAIKLIACGKGYRSKDSNIIKHTKKWARLDAHTDKNQLRTIKVQIEDGKTNKTFEIDDNNYKRFPKGDYQPVVLFEPNHLFLFHDEPSARRSYLDELIKQINPEFVAILNRYKRTLAQRNFLLKNNSSLDQIFIWDIKLSEYADMIVAKRLQIIDQINKQISSTYTKISTKKTDIKLHYKTKVSKSNYATDLLQKLKDNIDSDLRYGYTGYGPHKDDFSCEIDKKEISTNASRGEIRTICLSLKIIEAELIHKFIKMKPTLLLDDVFSELDGSRRRALTDFLVDHQTFITTTDADIISKNFSQRANIIALN